MISAKSVPPDPFYVSPRSKLPKKCRAESHVRLDYSRRCPKGLEQEMRKSAAFQTLFDLNNPYKDLKRRSKEVHTDNCLRRRGGEGNPSPSPHGGREDQDRSVRASSPARSDIVRTIFCISSVRAATGDGGGAAAGLFFLSVPARARRCGRTTG